MNKPLSQAFEAYQAGRFGEAETICRKLISLAPREGRVNFLLGMSLKRAGRVAEAAEWLKRAATLQPRSAEVLNGLGSVYSELQDYPHAADCFNRAIEANPRYADAHYNMGNACQKMRQYDKALGFYQAALRLNPQDYEAWTNLGNFYKQLNQIAPALAACERALQCQSDFALAHWNRALVLLLAGRLQEGFQEYEWRWRLKGPIFVPRSYSQPLWNGQLIRDKTLLVHAEQGLGDAIQFVRYLRRIRPRAGRIVLETPAPIQSLFEQAACADQTIAQGEAPPPFDYYIPLMSLPRLCQTTLETIPHDVPYLETPAFTDFPKIPSGQMKVGLTWAGNAFSTDLADRSIRLEELSPLFEIPGIVFFGLQVPVPPRDEPAARALRHLVNLAPHLGDFRRTAAVIGQMDLVISVDTAVAHLAGALAKPVWTLLMHSPDWRWLLARSDSPWYPTMRLFRQTERGQWAQPIGQVARELRRWRLQHP
ncbi:MAG: tetratricopeptide repeat protein [Limisphaerales bacterium]